MELISKEEVKAIIECTTGYHKAIKDAFDRVMELPTIESRPKGKWKFIDDFGVRMCSKCGRKSPYSDNFCPSCGAVIENGRNYEQFKAEIMTKEEKLINDIKTLIDTEKYIEQHVLIYKGIKKLVEQYFAEMRGEE